MKEMYAQLGISSEVYDFGHKIEESLKERFEKFDKTAEYNQMKVLLAMQKNKVSAALPVTAMMILAVKLSRRFMQTPSTQKHVWYVRRSHVELMHWQSPYSEISVRGMNFWHLPENHTILWKKSSVSVRQKAPLRNMV